MLTHSFKKISLISAGNIISSGLGLLYITAAAKHLELHDFGIYALITSLLIFLSRIVDFGSNSYYVTNSITQEKNWHDAFLTLKVILFLVSIPISTLILIILNIRQVNLWVYFIFGLFFYTLNYTLHPIFLRKEQYLQLFLLNLFPALVKATAAILAFLGIIQLSLENAFLIFSFSIGSCALLLLLLPKNFWTYELHIKGAKQLLSNAYPAGISQLIQEGWPAVSNTLAKMVQNFSQVGIFSIAGKLANIFSLLSVSIFTVLLPKNAQRKKNQLGYDFKETGLIALILFLMGFGAVIAAEFFIRFILGNKFLESLPLLDILIISSSISAVHNFLSNYFYVEEKIHLLMWSNIIRISVFLLGALWGMNNLGLMGIALADVLASVVALSSTIYFIKKS